MASYLSPLDDVLKRSGAHMTEREGWVVAADFGSLAAEIAVSRATAGLADVSSIGKFEVRGLADGDRRHVSVRPRAAAWPDHGGVRRVVVRRLPGAVCSCSPRPSGASGCAAS